MRAARRSGSSRARGIPWVLAVLCVLIPFTAAAQDGAALYLSVHPEDGRLEIHIGNLFADEGLSETLHSGLPLRIRIVADLWKHRTFFDNHKGQGEWRASVLFDPLEHADMGEAAGAAAAQGETDLWPFPGAQDGRQERQDEGDSADVRCRESRHEGPCRA